jgi:hypothetical protein
MALLPAIVKYSGRILELMADGALNTVFHKKNLTIKQSF